MGSHPVNLAFRFILEIVSLIGVFRLGLSLSSGVTGWVLGLAFTLAAMILWATFRVPGDESANGQAPYPVSGPIRMLIEVALFGAGAVGWFVAGPEWMAWSNLAGLTLHHVLSYDRIAWLLSTSAGGSQE